MKYVSVIVDNNTDKTDVDYTYGCEFEDVAVGNRVFVPFAQGNKEKAAYVVSVSDELTVKVKVLKYIDRIDSELSLDENTIEICRWMKKRYFCRFIEAIKCFLPAGSVSKRGKKRRPEMGEVPDYNRPELTEEQVKAMETISPWMEKKSYRTFLVHGVTGSGKTELYLRAAEKTLTMGRSVIILVPEISLTPQTIGRFISRFTESQVAVLHSKLSYGERYDEWMRIKNGSARVVIGARSAVFAPFGDIGLIVVDEEHEGTYKSDTTPKYDTIEVAVKRGNLCGAVVILGSATPSLVSNYRVEKRYYEKILLKERYNKNPLPLVKVVDMREELRNGNKTIFSLEMYRVINETLAAGKQVILFLNRRGYSTFVSCRACGYVMKCPDCEISLIYHMDGDEARCHFCGYKRSVPEICPECGSKYLKFFGAGTEKVEETARELFPNSVVARLDMDTTKGKGSAGRILSGFKKGKTNILIGTQLVAKGLDFSNVGFVGIVSADVTLNVPDFRAAERAFQLITQASGRAGRGDEIGRVIIQSYKPDHYAVYSAANHDYENFYSTEMLVRKAMDYPPFSDLALITISSKVPEEAGEYADEVSDLLRKRTGTVGRQLILGPRQAVIFKNGELYRYQIFVKVLPGDREGFELYMRDLKKALANNNRRKCLLAIDINPGSHMS
ncbi:hypothetical protein FACS1894127_6850 [Clostridia bacterium]|nr:hypothetical protein FACS1894127_6850 [Clostridia bacterium]